MHPHRCEPPAAPPTVGKVWQCPHCLTRWLWSVRGRDRGYVRMRDTIEVIRERDELDFRRSERRAMLATLACTILLVMVVAAVLMW